MSSLVGNRVGRRAVGVGVRRLVWVVAATCALAACGASGHTNHAVPVPPGAKVGLTAQDGARQLSVLEDGDCVTLQITAGGRRYVSGPECPYDPFISRMDIQERDLHFNDRDVHVTPCPDDCAGPRPDLMLPAPIVWGRAAPEAGFVCVDGDHGPVVLEPTADGLVLAPVPGAQIGPGGDSVLSFLSDGRFIGTPGVPSSVQPPGVEACRAAGAPGRRPLESRAWPMKITFPRELADSGSGVTISTDTGYAPDGATFSVLAQGTPIWLGLHPDTTTIAVTHETEGPEPRTARLHLPRVITDALAEPGGCAVWRYTIVIRFDASRTPRLTVADNGRTC